MPSTGEFSSVMRAPVNKIIPFSNVDGPGNRTSIFFQGCPFNCRFCHNPETIHLCRNCGNCVKSCPAGALSFDAEGKVVWDSANCVQCDTCIKVCPHDASPKIRWMTVEEVLAEIRRALPYIAGITTSGGECTLQNEFLIELFSEVRKFGKTCLIDSNGSFDFEADPRVLEVSEGVMLDVKAVEKDWSDELISFPRDVVLKNLDYLIGKMKKPSVMWRNTFGTAASTKSSVTALMACGNGIRSCSESLRQTQTMQNDLPHWPETWARQKHM